MTPELQRLIEGLALRKPRPSAAAIFRQVRRVATDQGWHPPSYSTVYDVIRRLDPALVTLAHEGRKAYQERFDLLYRREASRPNEIWQADHTPLDLWILDEEGKPARPWLTVILDDYSRAVTDHGSDFTSQHLEQVAADIKMQLVFSWPGVPRGRGRIERFFETVHQLCVSGLPGYWPAGAFQPTPTLTLAELDATLLTFFLDDYHQRIHRETKARPQERWDAGGFLPRLPDSLEQLDLLLLTIAKGRRVQQDGIRFQSFRYIGPVLRIVSPVHDGLVRLLGLPNGQPRVDLQRLPAGMARVGLYERVVDPLLLQPCQQEMPQAMRRDWVRQAGGRRVPLQELADPPIAVGLLPGGLEEVAGAPVGQPVGMERKRLLKGGGEGYHTILRPFPRRDADLAAIEVDRVELDGH